MESVDTCMWCCFQNTHQSLLLAAGVPNNLPHHHSFRPHGISIDTSLLSQCYRVDLHTMVDLVFHVWCRCPFTNDHVLLWRCVWKEVHRRHCRLGFSNPLLSYRWRLVLLRYEPQHCHSHCVCVLTDNSLVTHLDLILYPHRLE
jgi:hypothetical protein